MTNRQNNSDAYDSPWKNVLEHAFPEFMAFYFPAAYARIDWARGHAFKNTELRQVVRDAELGKRFADALVQVTLEGGEPRWIYTRRTWVLRKARCISRAREQDATRRNSEPYCDESQHGYRVREMCIAAENPCVTGHRCSEFFILNFIWLYLSFGSLWIPDC